MLIRNQSPITKIDNFLNKNEMATLKILTSQKNVKWLEMLCKPLNIKQLCH